MSLFSLPKPSIPQFDQSLKKPKPMILELLIFLAVAYAAMVPQAVVTTVYTLVLLFTDPAFLQLISDPSAMGVMDYTTLLTATLDSGLWIAALICSGFMIPAAILYCRIFEKRPASTLGYTKKGFLKDYLIGAVAGLVMIALPVLLCLLTGTVELSLSESVSIPAILLFLFAFLLQGMGEEALFRGYLLTTLSRRGVWPAALISSLMFSLFHIANASFSLIAFLNIFLFGLFAAVITLKRKSIWMVGAIHSIWNFAQGNLFGFEVSGNPRFESVLSAAVKDGYKWFHGGTFGPEGGLAVTLLLLVALLIAFLIPPRKDIGEDAVGF